MTLPSAGNPISLQQVNVELGNSGTASINMGSAAVRGLFDVASGEIEMSDGYGKSNITVISSSVKEMTVSDHISSGGTLQISSGIYIWSDSTFTAGMIIDIPCTIINGGYIIGNGGDTGTDGGPAINITSSGVTITNSAGAYIAGGGGGGGGGRNGGGGGGAGGGGVNGGAIGQSGGAGTNSGAGGGGAGGGGGATTFSGGIGGGGGRVLPGSGGSGATGGIGPNGGSGGAAGNNGNNGADGGGDSAGSWGSGGGGGGWGATGGNGYFTPASGGSGVRSGGAGGAAISGTSRTLTNNGTIYGST